MNSSTVQIKLYAKAVYRLQCALGELKNMELDMISFVLITHLLGIYGLFTTKLQWSTCLFAVVISQLGLLGMTTGYHRLYSHRTYNLSRPVELLMLFLATTDFSMSAINWVRDHRAHHKYTDTDKDPYNITRGFWWAHIGWLLWSRQRPNIDVSDLEKDPVLVLQHKYYIVWAILFGWCLPMWICGYFFDDYRGGFFIACMLKTALLHHVIFSINSWAHWAGDTPFSDTISPRENLLCAILTLGEGYHNFHHEFPNDYRNGVYALAYDPTKWLLASLEFFGLATDLKRTSPDLIRLSKLQMVQKKIDQEKKGIFVGRPLSELPFYTKEQITELCNKGEHLVIEGDLVFDVKEFTTSHPGGSQYLTNYNGKDISKAFNGAVYNHSKAARNKLQTLRCGRLQLTVADTEVKKEM